MTAYVTFDLRPHACEVCRDTGVASYRIIQTGEVRSGPCPFCPAGQPKDAP